MKYVKSLIVFVLLGTLSVFAQNRSDMLENALSSVVTVAVFKTADGNALLGFKDSGRSRGEGDMAYAGQLDMGDALGSGSGFVVQRNGKKYVVTNAHVVEQASNEQGAIYVYSINRTKYEMKLVGGDTFFDLAVLAFVNTPGSEITTIDFRKSDIRVGEEVYAIGNPLGELPYSISDGIISGKNRVRDGVTGRFGFLQSTATVIWGNSGGPLIDVSGTVVGINSQIHIVQRDNQNFIQPQINYALEAGIANRLVNDIVTNNGFVKRSFVGIELSAWGNAPAFRKEADNLGNRPVISNFVVGSPAEKAFKNKIGYSVIKINGEDIRTIDEALGIFETSVPGTKLEFTIRKGKTEEKVSITTEELNPTKLEAIATYALDSRLNGNMFNRDNKLFVKIGAGSGDYRVMAAGMITEQVEQIWRVTSLSELGAALRISGMYGFMDLVVSLESQNRSKVEKERIVFEETNDNFKRFLWY